MATYVLMSSCYVPKGDSLLALVLVLPANAQIGKVFEGLSNRGETSDSKTASGLKEALQIGTDHAVDLTGTTDGFFKNEAIKILLPEKLRTAEKALRLAGMETKIDEFELQHEPRRRKSRSRRPWHFQRCPDANDF